MISWRSTPLVANYGLKRTLGASIQQTSIKDLRQRVCLLEQVTHTLSGLEAFLEGQSGTIIGSFSICNYCGRSPHFRLITDACPWGMGGEFTVDKWIARWFSTQITAYELKLFGQVIDDPAGQQTWEALARLVGLRLYMQGWALTV